MGALLIAGISHNGPTNADVAAYNIAGVPQIRGVFGADLWTRKRYHWCCGNLGGGLL